MSEVVIPTDAIVDFTFETPCQCCGWPRVDIISGGIAASGRYRIYVIPPDREDA